MARASAPPRRVAVAAIDFGTTNTGFGYYLRTEHEDLAAQNIKLFSTVDGFIIFYIYISILAT